MKKWLSRFMKKWLSYFNDPVVWAMSIVFVGGSWVGIYLQEATHNASLALLSVSGVLVGMALSWAAFKRAKAQRGTRISVIQKPSERPILDNQKLVEWFRDKQCCPDCGSTQFLEGPRGGGAQNLLCPGCHSEFNFGLPLFVHRNGEPGKGRKWPFGLANDASPDKVIS